MALVSTDWEVNVDKSIRYVGAAHGEANAGYVTVLELHRWLQDLADAETISADDFLSITVSNPTDKKFDTIIQLLNGFTLYDTGGTPAPEYIYGGTIIQGSGGTEVIWDGISVISSRGVKVNVIQNGSVLTNDFWNNVPNTAASRTNSTGTVTGVNADAQKVLNVSNGALFTAGNTILIGGFDQDEYVIDSISGNALTLTENLVSATAGGEVVYFSVRGLNPDATNGLAMQFMVKVKTAGAAIDGGALIFTTREWGRTYSEFRIPSTGRGKNAAPLTYAADLNNATAIATVSAYTGISNVTAGYNAIDVDNNAADEYYYSEWDRGANSINSFYQYMKWLTRAGNVTTLYGIPGEKFRGITHEITVTTPRASTIAEGVVATWTGGTGQVLARDSAAAATKVWIQLLTGVAPTAGQTITVGGGSVTAGTGTPSVERTLSAPFCGASTGSSLVGAYGFSLEYADLAVNDKITALDAVTRQPPNNVTFTVGGILSGWRILVGPETGGGLDYNQLTSTAVLSGAAVTSVTFVEAAPANTPSTGTIRILRANGAYTRHPYSAYNAGTKTFTITSHDFSSNNSNATKKFFISYIDADSVGTSISFNTIQTATQTLYVSARFGGTGPAYTDSIKPAATTGSLGSTGGSATISSVSDA